MFVKNWECQRVDNVRLRNEDWIDSENSVNSDGTGRENWIDTWRRKNWTQKCILLPHYRTSHFVTATAAQRFIKLEAVQELLIAILYHR